MHEANWYAWLQQRLQTDGQFDEVVLKTMPDPMRARRSIWLPFILSTLKADAQTIIVGHSSGAGSLLPCSEPRLPPPDRIKCNGSHRVQWPPCGS